MFFSQLGHLLLLEISSKWFWFFGTWEQLQSKPELVATSGLCYWLKSPTLNTLRSDPFRAFVYIAFMLFTCALLSRLSIRNEECEENPEKVIYELLGPTHVTMAGVKDGDSDEALKREVARLVPVAAIFGGLVLGSISVICDIFGVIGGGQGMLLATSIMYGAYEMWKNEQAKITQTG